MPARRRPATPSSRYAGMEPGRPVGGTYYLYRTLRNLDLDGLLDRLMEVARRRRPGRLTGLEERLVADEYRAPDRRLRRSVESEIRPPPGRRPRRRGRWPSRSASPCPRTSTSCTPPATSWPRCTRRSHPLTRKLAVRLARKRRHRRKGPPRLPLDLRHSLSTGGVPVEPAFAIPGRPSPRSWSSPTSRARWPSFARFTLHLVYAISSQFSKVRSFVFIDGIDEVTRLFEGADDPAEAVHRINTEADVVWVDGHSDYGHAFSVF